MTTTVKLITHGWPVQVTTTDHGASGEESLSTSHVEPNSEQDFYIHSTRSVSFKELPELKVATEPASDDATAA